MPHINFYRKYRPQKFAEVLGQKEIIAILKNAVSQNKLHHAYLFAGMQGVGKTSTARIFAQTVNCLNNQLGELCGKCSVCQANQTFFYDVIEIDAASHNGVEQIRNLQENAVIRPTISTHKVYIIDEVHMLSKSAFNAFLKLLEEPPRHIIFILATTEVFKIPDTILSRCQRFHFQAIPVSELTPFLATIAQKELLAFEPQVMEAIADYCQGSVRDALNILEQVAFCKIGHKIVAQDVFNYFGYLDQKTKLLFLQNLLNQNQAPVFEMITIFAKNNINFQNLTWQMLDVLKNCLMDQVVSSQQQDVLASPDYLLIKEMDSHYLQDVINLFFAFYPRFHYQLKTQLIFEIMCLQVFALVPKQKETTLAKTTSKKPSFSQSSPNLFHDQENKIELTWALQVLQKKKPQLLKEMKQKWLFLDNYLHDQKFGLLAKLFSQCFLVACSPEVILLRTSSEQVRNQVNNLSSSDLLLAFNNEFFNYNYQFKAVTMDELNVLKLNYHEAEFK